MSRGPSATPQRRRFPRATLELPVTVVRRQAELDHPGRVVGLRVTDVSRGGIGALAPEPLAPGEPVVVFFPPMGTRRGRDTRGQVVRCREAQDRFRVGIEFGEPWPEHEAALRQ